MRLILAAIGGGSLGALSAVLASSISNHKMLMYFSDSGFGYLILPATLGALAAMAFDSLGRTNAVPPPQDEPTRNG